MCKSTVVITIGRNIKNKPMSNDQWRMYASDVEMLFIGLGGELLLSPVFHIDGPQGIRGVWDNEVEEATVLVGFLDSDYGVRHLTLELNDIRKKYNQDAIGLIAVPGTNHVLNGV